MEETKHAIVEKMEDVNIIAEGKNVSVGKYFKAGTFTVIGEPTHVRAYEDRREPLTIIGDGVTVGTHCTIYAGVKLGNHCLVEDMSVVKCDIPDNCIAAGNPAKVIGRICNCGVSRTYEGNMVDCYCSITIGAE